MAELLALADPEARSIATEAFVAAAASAVAFGAPPRPHEAPAEPQRQVKTQRVDDGIEQSLVVY